MKYLLTSVVLLVASNFACAQDAETGVMKRSYDYKCHLELENGSEIIRDYYNQPINRNGNLQRMLATESVMLSRNVRMRIVKVHDCIDLESEFGSAKVRELDSNTMR